MCWWGSRRPLPLLYRHCVPFQSPPTTLVPLSLCWMALQQTVGFLRYTSRHFLHLKVSVVVQRLPGIGPSVTMGWLKTQDQVWIQSEPWTKTPIYQHCHNPRCHTPVGGRWKCLHLFYKVYSQGSLVSYSSNSHFSLAHRSKEYDIF